MKIVKLHYESQLDIYSNQMGKAFLFVGCATMASFVIMIIVSIMSPLFPVACLKVKVEGEFVMSSLSIAAIIMILYNLFSWSTLV